MSQANVNSDIANFKQNGIINIRTYAQECDQLDQILNGIASAGGGMTVVAGVWVDSKFDRPIFSIKCGFVTYTCL
jgi:exo-beta-1,3-glucanase (GH17 family)